MKKSNRVVDNKDFSKIIKTGHLEKSNTYKVYSLANTLGYVRVGIAASTKLGNAVVRSTIRRKIRAICDLLINYQAYSLDIIITPKNLFLENDFSVNRDNLKELFIRTGIKE